MQRWPISETVRKAVIIKLSNVLTDPGSSKREIISAAKALMSAEQQNQSDEHKVVDIGAAQNRNDRLASIAADLGIEASVIRAIEGTAGGGITGPGPTPSGTDAGRVGAGPGRFTQAGDAEQGDGDNDSRPG